LLAQWQIPAAHWPTALAARTEDDLLELTIPDRFINRILDNLFPRAIEAIAAQPEFVLPEPEAVERFAEEDLGSFLLRLTPEQRELVEGLEFPFVAVVGLDAGRFPRVIAGYPDDELAAMEDEQRRLFFVGCSRAMRALLVCGARDTPSPFLESLQPPTWARD
jgi:hypothetical protein